MALEEDGRPGSLTGAVGCGEIKARDLAASGVQNADELTLIGDPGAQSTDGVGVQVSGDDDLSPRRVTAFLQKQK